MPHHGPVLFDVLEPARHDPSRIHELLASDTTEERLRDMTDDQRHRAIVDSLAHLLVEAAYFRVFADAVARLVPSGRPQLPRTARLKDPSGVVQPALDAKMHPDQYRPDQIRALDKLNERFDSAAHILFLGAGDIPPLRDDRNPYHPIWRAIRNQCHASGLDLDRPLENMLGRMARQQYFTTLMVAERIVAGWAGVTPDQAAHIEGFREPVSVRDLAGAVLNNLDAVHKLMRVSPFGNNVPFVGDLTGDAQASSGSRAFVLRAYGQQTLDRWEREWSASLRRDFDPRYTEITGWSENRQGPLPRTGLVNYPTRKELNDGTARYAPGPVGRCPGPTIAPVPRALERFDRERPTWATDALRTLRLLQDAGELPNVGTPPATKRADHTKLTSAAELILVSMLPVLPELFGGRTTGFGRTIAPEPVTSRVTAFPASADFPSRGTRRKSGQNTRPRTPARPDRCPVTGPATAPGTRTGARRR